MPKPKSNLPSASAMHKTTDRGSGPSKEISLENRVLLASDDETLWKLLNNPELQHLLIQKTIDPNDILALDCAIIYIDGSQLNRLLVRELARVVRAEDDPIWRMVVVGEIPNWMREHLLRFIVKAPSVWSRKVLHRQLADAAARVRGEMKRQRQFKDRVYRIIWLYHQVNGVNGSHSLKMDKILTLFNITERTLRRDVKVLRDLFPDLDISYDRKFNS